MRRAFPTMGVFARLAARGYSLEFYAEDWAIYISVYDSLRRKITKAVSFAELSQSIIDEEDHLARIVDDMMDELEATTKGEST